MSRLEINLLAKEKQELLRQERRAQMEREAANYNFRTSQLAQLIRVAMPDVAESILEKLEYVYENLPTPEKRAKFRGANDVHDAFIWSSTREGDTYWHRIHNRTHSIARAMRNGAQLRNVIADERFALVG